MQSKSLQKIRVFILSLLKNVDAYYIVQVVKFDEDKGIQVLLLEVVENR